MTVAEQFAVHAIDTCLADLPPEARQRASVYILDSLGVGIAGSSVEGAQGLLRVASGWGRAVSISLGPQGTGVRLAAAFLNAWQMHNQEYDCLHEGAVVHAMASVLPAALAAAESRGGVSGAKLIVAVAVGADIAAGLGLAARAGFRFFARPPRVVSAVSLLPGACLASIARRLRPPSPGSSRRPAAQCRRTLKGVPCYRFRLHSTLGLHCNHVNWPHSISRPPAGLRGTLRLPVAVRGGFRSGAGPHRLGRNWRISEFSHNPFPRDEPLTVASRGSWRCERNADLPQTMLTASR